MYADNTAIICDVTWKNAKLIADQLSSAVGEISSFFETWKIKLNDTKTEFASLSSPSRESLSSIHQKDRSDHIYTQ